MRRFNLSILLLGSLLAVTSCSPEAASISPKDALYSVSFVTNGGESVAPLLTNKIETEPYTFKEGYTFEGWHLSSSLNDQKISFPYVVTSDLVLYASFIQDEYIPEVKFVTNGGSEVASIRTKYIEEEPVTIKEGYSFQGWYTDASFSRLKLNFPIDVSKDMTLYANWRKDVKAPEGLNLVTASVGAMHAESYWNFKYEQDYINFTIGVIDNYLYRADVNAGYNDNVEFYLSLPTLNRTGYVTNKTFHFLIDVNATLYGEVANTVNTFTSLSLPQLLEINKSVTLKELDKDGYNGYEAYMQIPYSLIGTNYNEAFNNLTLCASMRNRNAYTSQTYETTPYCDLHNAWTYLRMDSESGFVHQTYPDLDYMFLGDSHFNNKYWTTFTQDLSNIKAFTYNAELMESRVKLEQKGRYVEEEIVHNIKNYNPKNIVLSWGGEEINYSGETSTETATKLLEMITMLKEDNPNTNIYFVSINPLRDYPSYLKKISAINDALKEEATLNGQFNYIDTYSSFTDGKTIDKTLYANSYNFNSSGYSLYANAIKNALIK